MKSTLPVLNAAKWTAILLTVMIGFDSHRISSSTSDGDPGLLAGQRLAVVARLRTVMMKLHRLMCGILLIGLVGCNRTEQDWRQAKESNTVSAYTNFILKHPRDPHVNEAKLSLDDLDWMAAKTKNTLDGYNLYLTHHADGKHLADVKAGIEGLPLRLSISSVAVANRFQAYVGGGSNIEPPTPIDFGGGGGIPLISMSNGSAFLAGEVSSTDASAKLVRIEVEVLNRTQKSESFKIGDLSLAIAGARIGDFIAVGYDGRLCAMSDADRQKVKEILVEVSPQSRRTLSYIFALPNSESQQGQLMLQSAAPVLFEIGKRVPDAARRR